MYWYLGTYLDLQCIIAGWTLTGFKYLLLKSYIQNVFDISKLAAVYIKILIKHQQNMIHGRMCLHLDYISQLKRCTKTSCCTYQDINQALVVEDTLENVSTSVIALLPGCQDTHTYWREKFLLQELESMKYPRIDFSPLQ